MATHIKDIIAEFFRDSTAKKKEEDKVFEIINKTMAGRLKKYIKFSGVRDKKIVFISNTASARFEFKLQKQTILQAVQKEFPYIEEIVLRMNA